MPSLAARLEIEIRDGDFSRSSFSVENCFAYPVFCLFVSLFVLFFFFFHLTLGIVLSMSGMNSVGIFNGDESVDSFW
jgi:dolichyl-phosphate-mannose--protein O-mannosyl transferase